MAEEKIYPFEEALEKLSALVEKMESGDDMKSLHWPALRKTE